MNIKLVYKNNYKLDLTLSEKISIIVGKSASGKSTISKLSSDKTKRVTIKTDNGFKLIPVTNTDNDMIFYTKQAIYIIDDNIRIDRRMTQLIEDAKDVYFLILGRNLINAINLSSYSVFELITENGIIRNVPVAKHSDLINT